ncbi:recombinase family protein [Mycolicibacter hiberniae]|uniref:Integrase n=1 Tax=Mycolicibacter hiberniae TaxID=29314 RepID=A0A7I7X2T8_9MYCO|nr:recombinase family protein [Mycolicibacter hiberniae]MCV7088164.1 recombinase family protein [Mycolicibacter hiberniae]BBZ23914.1 integrase [Mycolicibacter hiberniae]
MTQCEPRRVLGRVRLSRATDESTSVERQREVIENWTAANGGVIVGWAEDIDVSGATNPFDTQQLGHWLKHRIHDFDVIATWKLDRLARNTINLNRLFAWCLDHDKTLVSCSESIDLSTPVGRLIASVIGFLAEGELEAIRERTKASRAKLRELGRWGGGTPPYGYTPVELKGGGWLLEVDDEAADVVRRIVKELLDGSSMNGIAARLTAGGIHTPSDRHRVNRGLKPIGRKWQVTPIRQILRGRTILGQLNYDGRTVRDDDGLPVKLADGLITVGEWERIQAILDGNSAVRKDARRSPKSLLSGIAFCAACGKQLVSESNTSTRNKTGERRTYRYYSCADRCSPMIRADELDTLADETFLDKLGNRPARERVWVPGSDNTEAMAEALQAVDELTLAAGKAASATMKDRLQRQLAALDKKIVELESQPIHEARWEWRETGGTYGDLWRSLEDNPEERRQLLERAGITFQACVIGGSGSKARVFDIRTPPELYEDNFHLV